MFRWGVALQQVSDKEQVVGEGDDDDATSGRVESWPKRADDAPRPSKKKKTLSLSKR